MVFLEMRVARRERIIAIVLPVADATQNRSVCDAQAVHAVGIGLTQSRQALANGQLPPEVNQLGIDVKKSLTSPMMLTFSTCFKLRRDSAIAAARFSRSWSYAKTQQGLAKFSLGKDTLEQLKGCSAVCELGRPRGKGPRIPGLQNWPDSSTACFASAWIS